MKKQQSRCKRRIYVIVRVSCHVLEVLSSELASLKAEVESLKQLCQELKNLKDIPESSKQVVREGEQIPGSKGVQPEDKNESSSGDNTKRAAVEDLKSSKKRRHMWEVQYPELKNMDVHCYDSASRVILQLYCENKETRSIFDQKLNIFKECNEICKKIFPGSDLFITGSTAAGYATVNSDIDMVIYLPNKCMNRDDTLAELEVLKSAIEKLACYSSISVVCASVPIITLKKGQIQIDIGINNVGSVLNTALINMFLLCDYRIRIVLLILKLWVKAQRIGSAKAGFISSFGLGLMLISYLQGLFPPVCPYLYDQFLELFGSEATVEAVYLVKDVQFVSTNESPLIEILIGFLMHYSSYDFAEVIRVKSHEKLYKTDLTRIKGINMNEWSYVLIEDPHRSANVGRAIRKPEAFSRILRVFSICSQRLQSSRTLSDIFKYVA